MDNKDFGYDIENCCSSEMRNDGFANVSTVDDCHKLIAQMCVQITDLKHENKLLAKALELVCERVKYFEEMQDKEMWHFEYFGYDTDYDLQAIIEQYKEQAQKEINNE